VETRCAEAGFTIVSGAPPMSAEAVVRDVLDDRPAALVVDLDAGPANWPDLVVALKRDAATRRVPIIGLSDAPEQQRVTARNVGCDQVLGRERLADTLLRALNALAPATPAPAWAQACQEPLSPTAIEGIRLFNKGEYFESHEALEAAWNAEPGPARALYRGLLQIAVAYLHIQRGNANGARKVFLRMWHWLDPLPAQCRGVDVAAARQAARRTQTAVAQSTDPGLADVDRGLLQPWIVMLPDATDHIDRAGTQDHYDLNPLDP